MSEEQKNSKLGLILILGGIFIAVITLGGYYASRNPGVVAGLFSGAKTTVNIDALNKTLTAAPECAGVATVMFKAVCAKKDLKPVPSWAGSLDEASRNCLRTSFRNITFLEMEYRREPMENFKDYDNDAGVMYHACDVAEDLTDSSAGDAEGILNAWYKKRLAEMKSVH